MRRRAMLPNYLKASLKTAVLITTVLLLGAGLTLAQQTVNLTAAPSSVTLPDGSVVPMWGYTCGTAAAGSTATCANLEPSAPAATTSGPAGWSPVVITVPYVAAGTSLTINLPNSLSFLNGNTVPTSLVIVGQLGGGLGTTATSTPSPDHSGAQASTTWPIAGNPGALAQTQGTRVQSFATEVAAGATTALTWTAPRPGTYLIESGTHPSIQGPMGLYGILVVTSAPSGANLGTAYPGVTYSADIPMLFGEIDAAQNIAVNAAVNTPGFSESATIGPFLGGPIVNIGVTNGGSGYTSAPTVHFASGAATATAIVDTDSSSPTYQQVIEIDIVNAGNYNSSPAITIRG